MIGHLMKHVHSEERIIARKDSDGSVTYLEIVSYAPDAVFGLDWLPDRPMFEADLILVMVPKGPYFSPLIYHSGVKHYTAKAISHLAGLAAAMYGRSKPMAPYEAEQYIENFKRDYRELSSYRQQGFYYNDDPHNLVWPGKIYKKNLFTASEFASWCRNNNVRL